MHAFWLVLTYDLLEDRRMDDVIIKTFFRIRHSLKLHWFADLMNVTEEVTIHRPNVSTLLSSAFIRGDLNAATRGPFFPYILILYYIKQIDSKLPWVC